MNSIFRPLGALWLSIVVSSAALAAPIAANEDPVKIALALQILDESHAKANALAGIDVLLSQTMNAFKQSEPNASQNVVDRFQALLRAKVFANLPRLMQLQARIWAEHFSEQELRQLVAFYKTPLAQHLVSESPKIFKEEGPVLFAWGQTMGTQAMQEALTELRKEGVKI